MVSHKFILFAVGVLTAVVGAIGLAVSFGVTVPIIATLPEDPRIYFALTLIFGLIGVVSSFTRRGYGY